MEQQQSGGNRSLMTGRLAGAGFDVVTEFAFRQWDNPNESVFVSGAHAGAVAAGWYFLPTVMSIKMAADITAGVSEAYTHAKKADYGRQLSASGPNFGGQFQDSQIGHTSRQRGLQAIQRSRLNARSALANEARALHRF